MYTSNATLAHILGRQTSLGRRQSSGQAAVRRQACLELCPPLGGRRRMLLQPPLPHPQPEGGRRLLSPHPLLVSRAQVGQLHAPQASQLGAALCQAQAEQAAAVGLPVVKGGQAGGRGDLGLAGGEVARACGAAPVAGGHLP